MFEKEAEEYFRENAYNFDEVTACRECMEFGYNKANEEHKQDELGLIISNSSARAEIEKQLEQAKKYLEECVYNVVSPERLRKDIEQFLKENE